MAQADAKVKLQKADLSQEIFGMDEATARISIELLKMGKEEEAIEEKSKIMTELFVDEIPYVAGYLTVAKEYQLDMFKKFILNFLQLRISRERLGRREMVGIAQGVREEKEKAKQGLQSLFAGLKG